MGGIFINYRAMDSFYAADLLFVGLTAVTGIDRVFLDSESIGPGADFVDTLTQRVRSADVVLAVIGPSWLSAAGHDGRRLIDDPTDWIRRELVEAFDAGVSVVPILTDHASMPTEADLPSDIGMLGRAQYLQLRQRAARTDLGVLVDKLAALVPGLVPAVIPHPLSCLPCNRAKPARQRSGVARRADIRRNIPIPRQLPAAPCRFVGRADELDILTSALNDHPDDEHGTTMVISAIGGTGGIGKSALALHWAHLNACRFPDGQLYMDLRGFDISDQPTRLSSATCSFLAALGIDPAQIPVDLDSQTALYRSLLTDKRMLIVLDNARDAAQVVPLLPGSATCTVLVTSRRHLGCLAATHGARLLDLDVLSESEARELLAQHLGRTRVSAEPAAVRELLTVCAGLPLALRIVAARVARHPHFSLAAIAEELRDAPSRLDALDAGNLRTNIRTVLSWSHHALGSVEATVFRLLGLDPGADIDLAAVICLTDLPCRQVRKVLGELETMSLVQQYQPGRYRMHDLVRLYAAEQAERDLSPHIQSAALRRLTDYYLRTARHYRLQTMLDLLTMLGRSPGYKP